MSKIIQLFDKLSNVMSGMGTTADRSVWGGYNFVPVAPQQAEASYRSSWMMRKIIDIPAIDMTRNWRAWQAERDQITAMEAEEKRLQLKAKAKRALILSRLWGGGIIVMGIKGQEPEDELDVERVRKGDLAYLHVFSRHQVQTGELITDPSDAYFGHPSYYQITNRTSANALKIHPSRVLAFVGQRAPEGSTMQSDLFWGDPVYQAMENALKNADLAQDGFAALIAEAKVDVIKIPELMKSISSQEYEDRLMSRLQAAAAGKSTWRSLVLDGAEEWDQKEVSWTGIPDMVITYLQMVSGAADIPITRFLGQSPKGLQSTGEGEEKNYHAKIEADQDEALAPQMHRLDEVLIRSALGSRPEEIWWSWVPLSQMSAKEAIEIEDKRATALQKYNQTGLFDSTAMAAIGRNAITESGQWPGSDLAFEEAEAAENDDLPENDPEARAELLLPGEADPAEIEDAYSKRKRRMITDVAFDDGKSRSLYVSRKVLNAEDILAHYADQGIDMLEPAGELHITIAYSETAIDWMEISPDWTSTEDGRYTIAPGGPRQMDLFGPLGDVLVLLLNDDHLKWRHEHMIDKGASWKWDGYQPHITLAKGMATDLDTDAISPWKGPIVLGPEIFEEIDRDR